MLRVTKVDINLSNVGFILLLKLVDQKSYLPIVIGLAEAHSISLAQNKVSYGRPLTHDLICNILKELHGSLVRVIINHYNKGTFYACLEVSTAIGKRSIDARPSDAIAIALRCDVPIFIENEVMNLAGHYMQKALAMNTLDEQIDEIEILEKQLQKAINDERYEEAAILRDQIKKHN